MCLHMPLILWERAFYEVAKSYPDITTDYAHVDATCMWMVKNPEWFDVIVTDNMFGDIITDLGAMIQGGMGIVAGGNINPEVSAVELHWWISTQVYRTRCDQSSGRDRCCSDAAGSAWPGTSGIIDRTRYHGSNQERSKEPLSRENGILDLTGR